MYLGTFITIYQETRPVVKQAAKRNLTMGETDDRNERSRYCDRSETCKLW